MKILDWIHVNRPLNRFWRPCRGLARLERRVAPSSIFHMTRRAFLRSRVIQAQGKFDSKGLVKNWCKWITKMKISQNLCVQLTPEQFSPLREVKTYPGMWSLCLAMRFRKICTGGCVRGIGQKIEIFMNFRLFSN